MNGIKQIVKMCIRDSGAAVGVVMALVVLVVFFVVGRLVKDDDLEL